MERCQDLRSLTLVLYFDDYPWVILDVFLVVIEEKNYFIKLLRIYSLTITLL